MIYIVIAIVTFLALILYGAMSRRRVYKEIDRLEAWKMQIMNRPLTEEISKVKGMAMIGETEEKFEMWRQEWDEMVTAQLPNLEEDLFDAEEYTDKYRFKKARSILAGVSQSLEKIELRIKEITSEINELVTSEELNREEIVEAKEKLQETKKYYLTHIRALGQTAPIFDKELDEIKALFETFESLTVQGSHLEARQRLVESLNRISDCKTKMQGVPELLVILQSDIPNSLKELSAGFTEMEQQGYVLHHIGIEKEISSLKDLNEQALNRVLDLELESAQRDMDETVQKMDQLYEMLENEVHSKQFVISEREIFFSSIQDLQDRIENLKQETQIVSSTYLIEQNEAEMQKKIEKLFHKLQSRFLIIEDSIDEKRESYSVIREMMEEMQKQMEELQRSQKVYEEMLHNLRKDELETKQSLRELRKKLLEARRMVQKSNLPGLPEHYLITIGKAEEYIIEVSKKLDEKPLEMSDVSYVLNKAHEAVNEGYDETSKMIENAFLAEKLIQYGNRFRSSYQSVSVRLIEAEIAFRNYQYEDALEIAASAIESVRPGILKEMEINLKSHV
ncbi:septation ring formation regulator EzrA [Fictibacillus sp. 5RED26]|uniref:septation ring formation regulator EzrA n=1 Tax=unclassified Fictibacillus TaxID=2644029 RepID=UPI0018CCAAC0|nr:MULTISPECIES: septation ring formation regulator EzrA [unclassified Fictibacillus]MBH0157849.1 septation ring formation regulator EzrA [Fictibacillus sp. 5RED26]MBH0163451.1 septation ring formation regulator EzrA [Fictibacillus sp. 7GRE50]MBH0175246.1 septation ring formation regulator EzrA [Fictibacillus sp. 23RED33]